MTTGEKLSAEDMRVFTEIAEKVVLKDPSLPSIKEVEARRADALRDACKPGLDEDEQLRLQLVVEIADVYIDLVRSYANLIVNYYAIKTANGE